MIGLEIIVENEYNNHFKRIFNGVNLENYVWIIEEEEILHDVNDELQERLFLEDVFDGKKFSELIDIDNYYMIFADFKAFRKDGKVTKINSYEEYQKSDCEIIFLCVDVSYVEIYCKDERILDIIHDNCIKCGFEKIKVKTVENDGRVRMSVY